MYADIYGLLLKLVQDPVTAIWSKKPSEQADPELNLRISGVQSPRKLTNQKRRTKLRNKYRNIPIELRGSLCCRRLERSEGPAYPLRRSKRIQQLNAEVTCQTETSSNDCDNSQSEGDFLRARSPVMARREANSGARSRNSQSSRDSSKRRRDNSGEERPSGSNGAPSSGRTNAPHRGETSSGSTAPNVIGNYICLSRQYPSYEARAENPVAEGRSRNKRVKFSDQNASRHRRNSGSDSSDSSPAPATDRVSGMRSGGERKRQMPRNQEKISAHRQEPMPSTSREPVPSTSREPVPSTSREPVPSTSREPMPSTSREPTPSRPPNPPLVAKHDFVPSVLQTIKLTSKPSKNSRMAQRATCSGSGFPGGPPPIPEYKPKMITRSDLNVNQSKKNVNQSKKRDKAEPQPGPSGVNTRHISNHRSTAHSKKQKSTSRPFASDDDSDSAVEEERTPILPTRKERRAPIIPTREERRTPIPPIREEQRTPITPTREERTPIIRVREEQRSPIPPIREERRTPIIPTSEEQRTPIIPTREEQRTPIPPIREEQPTPFAPTREEQRTSFTTTPEEPQPGPSGIFFGRNFIPSTTQMSNTTTVVVEPVASNELVSAASNEMVLAASNEMVPSFSNEVAESDYDWQSLFQLNSYFSDRAATPRPEIIRFKNTMPEMSFRIDELFGVRLGVHINKLRLVPLAEAAKIDGSIMYCEGVNPSLVKLRKDLAQPLNYSQMKDIINNLNQYMTSMYKVNKFTAISHMINYIEMVLARLYAFGKCLLSLPKFLMPLLTLYVDLKCRVIPKPQSYSSSVLERKSYKQLETEMITVLSACLNRSVPYIQETVLQSQVLPISMRYCASFVKYIAKLQKSGRMPLDYLRAIIVFGLLMKSSLAPSKIVFSAIKAIGAGNDAALTLKAYRKASGSCFTGNEITRYILTVVPWNQLRQEFLKNHSLLKTHVVLPIAWKQNTEPDIITLSDDEGTSDSSLVPLRSSRPIPIENANRGAVMTNNRPISPTVASQLNAPMTALPVSGSTTTPSVAAAAAAPPPAPAAPVAPPAPVAAAPVAPPAAVAAAPVAPPPPVAVAPETPPPPVAVASEALPPIIDTPMDSLPVEAPMGPAFAAAPMAHPHIVDVPMDPLPIAEPMGPAFAAAPMDPLPMAAPMGPVFAAAPMVLAPIVDTPMDPLPVAAPMDPLPVAAPMDPLPVAAQMDPLPVAAPMDPLPVAAPMDPLPVAAQMGLPFAAAPIGLPFAAAPMVLPPVAPTLMAPFPVAVPLAVSSSGTAHPAAGGSTGNLLPVEPAARENIFVSPDSTTGLNWQISGTLSPPIEGNAGEYVNNPWEVPVRTETRVAEDEVQIIETEPVAGPSPKPKSDLNNMRRQQLSFPSTSRMDTVTAYEPQPCHSRFDVRGNRAGTSSEMDYSSDDSYSKLLERRKRAQRNCAASTSSAQQVDYSAPSTSSQADSYNAPSSVARSCLDIAGPLLSTHSGRLVRHTHTVRSDEVIDSEFSAFRLWTEPGQEPSTLVRLPRALQGSRPSQVARSLSQPIPILHGVPPFRVRRIPTTAKVRHKMDNNFTAGAMEPRPCSSRDIAGCSTSRDYQELHSWGSGFGDITELLRIDSQMDSCLTYLESPVKDKLISSKKGGRLEQQFRIPKLTYPSSSCEFSEKKAVQELLRLTTSEPLSSEDSNPPPRKTCLRGNSKKMPEAVDKDFPFANRALSERLAVQKLLRLTAPDPPVHLTPSAPQKRIRCRKSSRKPSEAIEKWERRLPSFKEEPPFPMEMTPPVKRRPGRPRKTPK